MLGRVEGGSERAREGGREGGRGWEGDREERRERQTETLMSIQTFTQKERKTDRHVSQRTISRQACRYDGIRKRVIAAQLLILSDFKFSRNEFESSCRFGVRLHHYASVTIDRKR